MLKCSWCCCSQTCGSRIAGLQLGSRLQPAIKNGSFHGDAILCSSVRLRLLDVVQSGLHLSRVGGEDVEQALLEGAGLLLSGLQAGSSITFVYALPKMTETHEDGTSTVVGRGGLELTMLEAVRVLGTCSSRGRGSRSESCGATGFARRRTTKTEAQRVCMRCPEHLRPTNPAVKWACARVL